MAQRPLRQQQQPSFGDEQSSVAVAVAETSRPFVAVAAGGPPV